MLKYLSDLEKILDNMTELNTKILEKEIITEYRPWGYFTILEEKDNYKVKKLFVNPGQRLSLQLHHHRDEQWIIVKGCANLVCGESSKIYHTGESIAIPRGILHRIENNSDSPVIIIEVQNGEYLGEDDIVRFQDDYSRTN